MTKTLPLVANTKKASDNYLSTGFFGFTVDCPRRISLFGFLSNDQSFAQE
jgi:hypothetical protein